MREVTKVLGDFSIPIPKDLNTNSFFKHFLPSSFLHLAQNFWHDRYMYETALMLEISNARCHIVLDPFDLSLEWLQTSHAHRYPPHPHGQLHPHSGRVEYRSEHAL